MSCLVGWAKVKVQSLSQVLLKPRMSLTRLLGTVCGLLSWMRAWERLIPLERGHSGRIKSPWELNRKAVHKELSSFLMPKKDAKLLVPVKGKVWNVISSAFSCLYSQRENLNTKTGTLSEREKPFSNTLGLALSMIYLPLVWVQTIVWGEIVPNLQWNEKAKGINVWILY